MINFPFGTNGKLSILGVPILKHITVGFLGFIYATFIRLLISLITAD